MAGGRDHRKRTRARTRKSTWLRGGLVAGIAASTAASSGCLDSGRGQTRDPLDEPFVGQTGSRTDNGEGSPNMPLGAAGQPAIDPASVFGNPAEPNAAPTTLPQAPLIAPDGFLEDQVVRIETPATAVLYSWTTDEQYAELRSNPVLLTRTERPGMGGGAIRGVLEALANAGDPLSKALGAPEFQTARYAWPNPWATLQGWPGESYGTRLIQIVLRPEAWIMTLEHDEWQVVDMDNQPVTRADAIGSPERIGAIFHVHHPEDPGYCGTFCSGGGGTFREYFLPNEAMVAQWSLATDEMRTRLEDDISMVRELRGQVEGGNVGSWCPFETAVSCSFLGNNVAGAATDNYLASMAFASELYAPTLDNMDALIAALEGALFEPDPFTHVNE